MTNDLDKAMDFADRAIAAGNVAALGWELSKKRCLELEVELARSTAEWLRIVDGARTAMDRCDAALREIAAMEPDGPAQSIARRALRLQPEGPYPDMSKEQTQ